MAGEQRPAGFAGSGHLRPDALERRILEE